MATALAILGIDGFVNPALAVGATAAAVPLLIHLLNRQRHKPMPWAAMRFVLAAYRKTRRRAQLENLILLLLRMAAVALLAFAIARPFTGAHSPLAQLAESRRDLILVLDASASTGYRQDVRTVFEGLVARARDIVLELDGTRDDRVRLILAAGRPKLVAWRRPDEALSVLGTLTRPSDEPLDLAAALGEVARLAQEDQAHGGTEGLELRLLTDMQRSSFRLDLAGSSAPHAPDAPSALSEQLDQLERLGLRVLVEDLGPAEPTPPNVAITSIEPLPGLLVAGATVEVAINVRNFGAAPKSGVRVSLTVDEDQRLPTRPLDLPARGEARATFPVVFRAPGDHTLVARIDADRLAFDDERVHVAVVPPPVRVLIVDGESAEETERDEVGYLAAVLWSPSGDALGGAGELAPFEPRVIEPFTLRDEDLDLAQFDVIWLANLENPTVEVVEALERRVAAGAGLVISLGKKIEPSLWNARAFRADGTGLLAAELGLRSSIGHREGYFRAREIDAAHPALSFFSDLKWQPLLTEVPIYEFFTSRPLPDARVLARLDDDATSPLLLERNYDRGKVYLWTTTIDPEWTRLPESPRTLVPLVHEWLRVAATPAAPARNLAVNAGIVAELASFPRSPVLILPDGSRRAIDGAPEPSGPGSWRLVAPAATERAGLHRLELEGAAPVPFAIQADALEGDLERLGATELSSVHRTLVAAGQTSARKSSQDETPRQGELWRSLAIACLTALALETLWAAWIGRSRRIV